MGGSSSKNDFTNQIGTGNAGPPGDMELEIDADMAMLDLRLKRLDKLPWDLSVLTNLKELDLSMNLYTTIPDQCLWKDGHLATSLTKLSINQNRIQVIPEEIGEMKNLNTLCIYDNTLTSLPGNICKMESLTQLSVYNNFITALPEEFCLIPKLQQAYLSNNKLTALPEGMEKMTGLSALFLDGNAIQELPSGFFKMPALQELTLANNNLKSVPADLANMSTLTELYLNGAMGQKPTVVPDEVKASGVLQDCYEGQI
eukprot:CAMPEP_0181293390 /NCGR_PEP_ID=MMETSP1101-20121128/3040_1 /TAXON_ID=46948 /ORGANISM="Rhodomonas abbreviata, Strain Caron Lab Isolate" /LENGTH=256 /DNA_ID=CAMNT_0023397975 /DNA_START=288 /DNA_END=1055 /DNA_ORIENTATION=-